MIQLERAGILSEALPYIKKYNGKTIVVKYGGNAMQSESLKQAVISDVVLLSLVGIRVVLVHGGGPDINAMLDKIGKEAKFINGLRYTDKETMDIVQMVLGGKVGKDLASLINQAGGKAISMSGQDAQILTATRLTGDVDYGWVGEIKTVNPHAINMALDNGYIPIISTVAQGEDGAYNINADTAAAEIATALKAENLILLTDIAGICTNPKDESTLIHQITLSEVNPLIKKGIISGGMIPKLDCCVQSVRHGVGKAVILDGRVQHSILVEMLTDAGLGTMIVAD